jgi:hypothetical protein
VDVLQKLCGGNDLLQCFHTGDDHEHLQLQR